MNKKWKIATILGIMALTCGAYTWGIPAIVNIQAHKSTIEKKVYENSGYKIDIGNPKLTMGFFPSVWVSSDNISLLNDDNSKALSIDNPRLKIKLLPLLRKKIEISRLSATKEVAYFVFTKDSELLIGQYPLKSQYKEKKFTLSKMDMNLGEYSIYLDDQKNSKQASLIGNYFEQGKYIQNKRLKFATESTLTVGDKSSNIFADVDIDLPIGRLTEDKFRINANIKDFDLSSISDYVSYATQNRLKSISGIMNFNADTKSDKFGHKNISTVLTTKNLAIIGDDRASSIIYPNTLTANINFDTVANGINFEKTTLSSDKIYLELNGKVFDIGKKAPKYNFTAEVKDTRLEDVVAIFPWTPRILPEFNLYKLKKHIIYGDGEGKLTFVGQGNRPNVTGEVKLRDAYVIKPVKGAPENVSVDMNFIGKHMLIKVFAPVTKDQNVTLQGKVWIDGSKYSELNVTSTDRVPLAPAQDVLNPMHEILRFQMGPIPLMKIAGYGNVNVRSAGKKVDPHIWGKVNFFDARASFIEVKHLELQNGSGVVNFNDKLTTFWTNKAYVYGKPIDVHGDCVALGEINTYVTSKGHDIKKLVRVIKDSPILFEVDKVLEPFGQADGIADVYLHIYGTATNAEEAVFNEDLFSRGTVTLHNARTLLQDTFLPFTGINGVVNFDKYDSDYDVTGYVRNSKVHVVGTGSNSIIDLKAYSDKTQLNDVFDLLHPDMLLPYKDDIGKIYASFAASYKGLAEAGQIDYNKLLVDGKLQSNMHTENPIKFNGGTFNIKNGLLSTSTLNGLFNGYPASLSFVAKDLDKEDFSIAEATFNFKNFDISSINTIKDQIKLPKDIAAQIDNLEELTGVIDINGTVKNNDIYANTDLKDTSFVYKPAGALVKILSGRANMRGTTLYLDKINTQVSGMPVFVDGRIYDTLSEYPNLSLSLSAKLTQQFFDRFFNAKSVYPVKTKGNINFHTKLRGPINALNTKSTLKLDENSSIYYMGATIAGAPTGNINTEGITTNPISIATDATIYPDKIKLNSLKYDQTITSQNKKKSVQNQLVASGEFSLLENNIIGLKDVKIKTENPTNARIFNVLFKKPTIKQGVFTTDLTINGTSTAPYILGLLNVTSVDIPLLDATVRDINVDFKEDFINLDAKAVVLTNDILAKMKIVNNPKLPIEVEDINIQMDALNLNVISDAINDLDADNTRTNQVNTEQLMLQPGMLIIKNAQINADNVLIKKANATDFKAQMNLGEDQVFRMNNYSFNIANGTVEGSFSHDLKTYQTDGEMHIKNADASIISENFFDMPGQMYGTVTGDLKAGCTGLSSIDCINTLSGEGTFNVTDGRMPKLGSLEYLLKAGNLITSGVTGISINGIIDLITPLKTGDFKSISGDIKVNNGVADEINVYSSGQDLNMYLTGSYNIASLVADMEVYGSLSKNFSTILGRIGNSSLNTLFNTIPGIKINDINPKSTSNINKIPNFDKSKTLRVFKSEIYGDINGSSYVKSFRWIKD